MDSAHTVCRPVRFTASRFRFLGVGGSGRRPLEFGEGFCVGAIGFRRHFATLPIHVAPSFSARLQTAVSLGPTEGATTHNPGLRAGHEQALRGLGARVVTLKRCECRGSSADE